MSKRKLSPITSDPVWDIEDPKTVAQALEAIAEIGSRVVMEKPIAEYSLLDQFVNGPNIISGAFSDICSLIRKNPKRVKNTLKKLGLSLEAKQLCFLGSRTDTPVLLKILKYIALTQPYSVKLKLSIECSGSSVEYAVSKHGIDTSNMYLAEIRY